MTEITGSNATAGLKVATTFGTAATLTTGDKMVFESLTPSYGGEVLQANPLGSGDIMTQVAQKGAFSPTTTIERNLGYADPGWAATAQLFGGASIGTIGSGYSHSIMMNEIMNQRYLTLGCQLQASSIMEHASAVCTSVKLSASNPPSYIKQTITLLAEDLKTTGTTNSFGNINALTAADSELVVFDPTSEFRINTQSGGALAATDRINITGFEVEYNRPQQHAREAKGSAGNTAPIATNDVPFSCTLTVTCRSLGDLQTQFLTAYGATTEYKASIINTGTVLAGANSKEINLNFPRLKIVEGPDFAVANAGNNEFTVEFMALVASSNPTGMIDVYPNIIMKNNRTPAWSA